jgi:hypothetical protein
VRNCSQRWKHDSAGDTAFLAHLINLHRFPILFDADGQAVGSIEAGQERKLTNLLPYVPDTTKAIPDVELQHPDRSFDGFYIRVRVDYLRRMAQAGHKRVLRTDKVPPALKKKLITEQRQRTIAKKTAEELAAAAALNMQRSKERYANDPGYADKLKQKQRERYANDPGYADKLKQKQRERYASKRARMAEEEEQVAEPSRKKKKKTKKDAADQQPQAGPSSSRQTRSQTRRT